MNLHDLIAQTACEIYVTSGRAEGRDLDNWLEAERLVTRRLHNAEELDEILEYQSGLA
jgi:hypothetical protein